MKLSIFAGILAAVGSVALHPNIVGQLVAADGGIDNARARLVLFAGQGVLAVAAFWLLLRPRIPALGAIFAVCAGYCFAAVKLWPTPEPPMRIAGPQGFNVNWNFDQAHYDRLSREGERAAAAGDFERASRAAVVLGQIDLSFGRVDEALAHFRSSSDLARKGRMSDLPFRHFTGLALLRRGEVAQCIHHHNQARCLFPVRGDGVWSDPSDAIAAAEIFESILREQPDSDDARWLLNLALMASGQSAEKIPPEWRLPPSMLESSESIPEFQDLAAEAGISGFSLAGSVVVDDFDRDGRLDFVTSSFGPDGGVSHHRNEGDGRFSDRTEQSELTGIPGGLNLVHMDFNNDGLLDLLVLRGAWQNHEKVGTPNSLLQQLPDGTFRDVSAETGLASSIFPTQAAAWADFDNDGFLDLFIGNERGPGELFHNNKGRQFVNVTATAGIDSNSFTKGVAWGDYDNDGDPDLFISNYRAQNQLYRNNADGTFTETSGEAGLPSDAEGSFATWFFDANNDGWLDLFVCQYNGLTPILSDYFGKPSTGHRLKLFLNREGRFEDVSESFGIHDVRSPMGANFGDFDGDGWLDLYLGTGGPRFDHLTPNVLYRNAGGEGFKDVTVAAGVGHLQKGHGIGFGDIDGDGDQDFYAQMGGFNLDDKFNDALFVNPGTSNSWITIRLEGRESNRPAVGARVELVIEENGVERSIHRQVSTGGSFGNNSLQLEIGLGAAEIVRQLRVHWPTSRSTQLFENIAANRVIAIAEGESDFDVVEPAE